MPRALVPHLVLTLLVIGAGVARLASPPGHARVHILVAAALLAASFVVHRRYMRSR
jgi:hypothetical protein